MISIGSFDYTVDEAVMLYMVDSNKGVTINSILMLRLACLKSFLTRYLKGVTHSSYNSFGDFVLDINNELEIALRVPSGHDSETWEPEASLKTIKVPYLVGEFPEGPTKSKPKLPKIKSVKVTRAELREKARELLTDKKTK